MTKWKNIRVDFAADMNDHPDLVTGQCPFCKRFHTTLYFYGLPMEQEHFCPHCGARMDEEASE